MANTYTQIHLHVIFATKFRKAAISPQWEKRLYEYLIAIFHNHGHRVLAINGMPDHIHILFGMRPIQSLSDLIKNVKSSSSKWINENRLSSFHFEWQEGFSAFSYSKSQLPKVIQYIENQKNHHLKTPFTEEYTKILNDLGVEYDPKYIFKKPQ
ncbi:IS200/IS605 family transposase [Algoriphagus zhangzhouensis]|uniref:REP element-mobilizing transposase RayT n=1 Tax=Algoriphagus zhangzhouensis TaxID=1073327 RepID=A0A1M7ZG36_9BACT|nr:IS200/IS605 family transposase [Algoriphagus zhangzhouensis]TDY44860.1 REP element-mobilizing transposase RayT [Algoriphagus zhangzhouensis]SHO63848.1 REP element-mobilizing transposase RayT [Algoriphagus zhangzhouensis]